MLQETVLRLDSLAAETSDPIVVCNAAHGAVIRGQLRAVDRPRPTLVYEPEGRNTAPAAAAAAMLAKRKNFADDPILVVLPADHVIQIPAQFEISVDRALAAVDSGGLVAFGVEPDRPETGYGYIKRGAKRGDAFDVESFVEKPDRETAQAYLSSGGYSWNSGMFMFKASSYLAELELFAPEILAACSEAVEQSVEVDRCVTLGSKPFLACPSDSIDYAVMERTSRAIVVPLEAGWSDVGSWAALQEASDQDDRGNVVAGDALAVDCQDSFLHSSNKLVVGVGLTGTIVVDTPDALLVMPGNRAEQVKDIVATLEATGRQEALAPARTLFSWGSREVLEIGERYEVQRFVVSPGEALAFDAKRVRDEHWVVVSGAASVTSDGRTAVFSEGQIAPFPAGVSHRLENSGVVPLRAIAVVPTESLGQSDVATEESV